MHRRITFIGIVVSAALLAVMPPAIGQSSTEPSFDAAAIEANARLEEALTELARTYDEIAEERRRPAAELAGLESELAELKRRASEARRVRDSGNNTLFGRDQEIKQRSDEVSYLSTLLADYVRKFESRLHDAEVGRFEDVLADVAAASGDSTLAPADKFSRQAAVIDAAFDRIDRVVGGDRFDGLALSGGKLVEGQYALIGPAVIFRSADGSAVGTVELEPNGTEPTGIPFSREEDRLAGTQVATSGSGIFPFDPSLGNAAKILATEETFFEHVQKGGLVMIPIGVMAGLALLIALCKWVSLMLIRKPSDRRIDGIMRAVSKRDQEGALIEADEVGGPVGEMLAAGLGALGHPKELIEELMYERMLMTRLRVNSWLPFIAICAASAPLLGLLGTVTGIINTFKLIELFGAGDVKSLSGGISEALITTKFGLIVAIPSLLLHAVLARRARGVVDQMQRAAVALVNEIGRSWPSDAQPAVTDRGHEPSGGDDDGGVPARPEPPTVEPTRDVPVRPAPVPAGA